MKNNKTLGRSDKADAFIAEPGTQTGRAPDELAEYLGEQFVSSATGAEDTEDTEDAEQDVEALGATSGDADESATSGDELDLEEEPPRNPPQTNSRRPPAVTNRARDRQRRAP